MDRIVEASRTQARWCEELGSPFTAGLLKYLAERFTEQHRRSTHPFALRTAHHAISPPIDLEDPMQLLRLRSYVWPGEAQDELARAHPHGAWVRWLGS